MHLHIEFENVNVLVQILMIHPKSSELMTVIFAVFRNQIADLQSRFAEMLISFENSKLKQKYCNHIHLVSQHFRYRLQTFIFNQFFIFYSHHRLAAN